MRTTLLASVALVALGAAARADQNPTPSRNDSRVGYFTYKPGDVYRIWSAPGGTFLIQLPEGETYDASTGADTCPPGIKDHTDCGIDVTPRGNFVYLKFWRCLIPEMYLMGTKTADGKQRAYNFEVHTEPAICPAGAEAAKPKPRNEDGFRFVNAANAAPADAAKPEPGIGNIKYVETNAMTTKAAVPIFYSAIFLDPLGDAAKRKESGKESRERAKRERADYLLSREVEFSTFQPRPGIDNTNYKWRGSQELRPRHIWDSEDSTKMSFPGMQEAPVLYLVDAPEGYQCRDDEPAPENERLAQYVARRDTLIATGTSRVWRLRGSNNRVLDECNLSYTPFGGTTGTGTLSPYVQRVFKGGRE